MQNRPRKENNSNSIVEHNRIKDFLQYCHYDSFIVLDLDNTIVESSQELGSDQWFVKLMNQACKICPGQNTVDQVIELYYAVQNHITLQTVEQKIVFLINALQEIGIPIIALTARGASIIKPTIVQLHKLGIHFDRQWGEFLIDLNIDQKKSAAIFINGILFCNGYDKGKCLNEFFKHTQCHPRQVVMVDDKERHLKSVEAAVKAYSGKFNGVRYSFLDQKAAEVNMVKADQQLLKMVPHFNKKHRNAFEAVTQILNKNTFFKSDLKPIGKEDLAYKHQKRG